jgi:hypothetical protein
MSICSIEDVAAQTAATFWFQLYVMRDRNFIERLIDRANAANCGALVLTLDLQVLGQRHKDFKNGLSAPPRLTIPNILNMMTKPRWCLGMLGTSRRQFGNVVGHVKGVADMGSLSEWTARRCTEQHRGAAGDRRRGRPPHRGAHGRRHPQRPGLAQGLGAGRARYLHRPRLPVWLGRAGAGRGDEGTRDHPPLTMASAATPGSTRWTAAFCCWARRLAADIAEIQRRQRRRSIGDRSAGGRGERTRYGGASRSRCASACSQFTKTSAASRGADSEYSI